MRQANIVIGVEEHQLLPQAVLPLAQRGDTTRIGKTNAILPPPPHGQRGAYRLFPSSPQPNILLAY
jgi:hypothetical protein